MSKSDIKKWCYCIKRDNEEKDDEQMDGSKSPVYVAKDYEDSVMIGDMEVYNPWYSKCNDILKSFPSK